MPFFREKGGETEGISPSSTPKTRRYAKVKTLTYLLNHMVKTVALTNSLSAGYSLVLLDLSGRLLCSSYCL